MAKFSATVLTPNPAKIALGGAPPEVAEQAATTPDPGGPACHAALAGYRTALMFRVLFTGLVFVVSLAAASALVYAIIKIIDDGPDLGATVTGVSGVIGSGAAFFLGRKMKESIAVARKALEDVGTYCGTNVRQQVE